MASVPLPINETLLPPQLPALNNNTEFYGNRPTRKRISSKWTVSSVRAYTACVPLITASMSRSVSRSKLAGTVGSKGKKESVAPDEVQSGSHGNARRWYCSGGVTFTAAVPESQCISGVYV